MTALTVQAIEPSEAELSSFIQEVPHANVFQTPEMVATYRRTKGCRACVLGVIGTRGALQASLVSVVFRDAPAVAHASIRGGPLCRPDEGEAARFLLTAHENRVQGTTLYSRIYPLSGEECSHEVASACGFERTPWLNYLIPLEDLDAQWALLSRSRQKGIRKAERSGVVLRDVKTKADLDALVSILRETARRGRFPMQHPSLFAAAKEVLAERGMARFVLADIGGAVAAARVMLAYGGVLYDWYAGSDPAFHSMRCDEWLIWELVKWGHARGMKVLDFGGAGIPGESYGPAEFKRQFNGIPVEWGRYTRVHHPRALRFAESMQHILAGSGSP